MYFKFNIIYYLVFNGLTINGLKFGINNVLANEEKCDDKWFASPIFVKWIEQKLDHFDLNETRTWKMRYYERLDYWRPNGTVYLFIGGESSVCNLAAELFTKGIFYDLAKETKGAMFLSEHRYYGESQPLNKSSKVEDLKFLSSRQALADIANLLRTIKKNISEDSKVVVVGGSYAGNLATWMKLNYPYLVDAAIASSAPVLAKRDFYEYLEVVGKDYQRYGGPGCLEKIQNIFQIYDSLFQSQEGLQQIKEENIRKETSIIEPENKVLFFINAVQNFSTIAQSGTPEKIKQHCCNLSRTYESFVKKEIKQFIPDKKQKYSIYNFDFMAKSYRNDGSYEQICWMYQSCTEFGYFKSTSSDNQPFTKNIPVEFFDKLCTFLFGTSFGKDRVISGVKATNEMYGGKFPNVTQVVFVNGELDPWSALGVLEDISPDAPAILIPKSSHVMDLRPEDKCDPEELKEARIYIKKLIKKWIGFSG